MLSPRPVGIIMVLWGPNQYTCDILTLLTTSLVLCHIMNNAMLVTPLLNGQSDKVKDQRSGILHIVRDP